MKGGNKKGGKKQTHISNEESMTTLDTLRPDTAITATNEGQSKQLNY